MGGTRGLLTGALLLLCLSSLAVYAEKATAVKSPRALVRPANGTATSLAPKGSIQRVVGDDGIASVQLLRRRHAALRGAMRAGLLSLIALSAASCMPGWIGATDGPGLGPLCALALSVVSNALFYLCQRWSLQFKVAMEYRPVAIPQDSNAVLVVPKAHRGDPALEQLVHEPRREKGKESSVPTFVYQHRGYVLTRGGFQQRRPSHRLPLSRYLEAGPYTGVGGLAGVRRAVRAYGPNKLDVAVPAFKQLLLEESLSPVAVIKALELVLALLEGSPPFMLALSGFMFLAFRLRCALMVRRNLLQLRAEVVRGGKAVAGGALRALREGEWLDVRPDELAPGDVVCVAAGVREAPADMLVLAGQGVVDEAILTGESLPQLKTPVAPPGEGPAPKLDMEGMHRPHVIFSGTRILRIEASEEEGHGPPPPEDVEGGRGAIVARVLRTGYFSTQGELLRMVDFRKAKVDADSADTLRIFGITGLLSFSAAISMVSRGGAGPQPVRLLPPPPRAHPALPRHPLLPHRRLQRHRLLRRARPQHPRVGALHRALPRADRREGGHVPLRQDRDPHNRAHGAPGGGECGCQACADVCAGECDDGGQAGPRGLSCAGGGGGGGGGGAGGEAPGRGCVGAQRAEGRGLGV